MTYAEFWSLSLRELSHVLKSRNRVRKEEHNERLAVAALQTAELVNVMGSLVGGKKWKPIRPIEYFEAWTATKSSPAIKASDIAKREREIEAGIVAREAKVIARRAAQSAETQIESDAQA